MRRRSWRRFVSDDTSPKCSNLEFTSKPGMLQKGVIRALEDPEVTSQG